MRGTTNPVLTSPAAAWGQQQMGEALIRGFINSGISSPGRISCSVDAIERRQLYEGMGVGNVFDAAELGGAAGVAANSDIVVLAVKPQVIQPVLGEADWEGGGAGVAAVPTGSSTRCLLSSRLPGAVLAAACCLGLSVFSPGSAS